MKRYLWSLLLMGGVACLWQAQDAKAAPAPRRAEPRKVPYKVPVPGAKRTLRVVASGFINNKGYMACLLFGSAKGFPGKPALAVQAARSSLKKKRGVCEFKGVAAGTYAVSVIHDANDNKKLDTNFFGIPKEGYGFSNNARSTFGPPSFAKASFRYHRVVQGIHIRMIN